MSPVNILHLQYGTRSYSMIIFKLKSSLSSYTGLAMKSFHQNGLQRVPLLALGSDWTSFESFSYKEVFTINGVYSICWYIYSQTPKYWNNTATRVSIGRFKIKVVFLFRMVCILVTGTHFEVSLQRSDMRAWTRCIRYNKASK